MEYKRYEKYKDSGIEWIGNIPEHWGIDRLKNSIIGVKNGIWGDEPQGDENDVYCIRVADFDRIKFEVESKNFTVRNLDKKQQQSYLLKKNDLLIEKSGGGEKQPVGFVVRYNLDLPAIYANFMAKMELNDSIAYSNFFKYLHSAIYAQRINVRSIKQTTGIQNLDTIAYFQECVVYPPVEEQKKIAEFLDQKTFEIDDLIADKEKLVELLQEQRQAIITEVVTKGLNPNVKMKDSGIEWIGEIPEHWRKTFIKYIGSKEVNSIVDGPFGSSINVQTDYVDEGIPVIRTVNITDNGFVEDDLRFMKKEKFEELKRHAVYPGDILLSKVGTIGNACILPSHISEAILSTTGSCKISVDVEIMYAKYLVYLFQAMKEHFKMLASSNVQPFLNMGTIKNISIPLPNKSEQELIVRYINKHIQKIDNIINDSKSQITNLNKYRQSLISEAVTGKIDVRGYSA